MVDMPKETDRPVTWRMWLSHHFCKKGTDPMTDQKQAPERKFPDWIDVGQGRYGFSNIEAVKGNSCRYIRKDLHDAAIKQRDELAAAVERMAREASYHQQELSGLIGQSRMWQGRAEKAEAERDEMAAQNKNQEAMIRQADRRGDRLKAERDQALAASAAREIAMRDRAAAEIHDWYPYNGDREPIGQEMKEAIRALPPSPDGQQALDDMLADAWDDGYSKGKHWNSAAYDNPHRKEKRNE